MQSDQTLNSQDADCYKLGHSSDSFIGPPCYQYPPHICLISKEGCNTSQLDNWSSFLAALRLPTLCLLPSNTLGTKQSLFIASLPRLCIMIWRQYKHSWRLCWLSMLGDEVNCSGRLGLVLISRQMGEVWSELLKAMPKPIEVGLLQQLWHTAGLLRASLPVLPSLETCSRKHRFAISSAYISLLNLCSLYKNHWLAYIPLSGRVWEVCRWLSLLWSLTTRRILKWERHLLQ